MDYDNDTTASIPRLTKPVSLMHTGLNSNRLSHTSTAPHPVLALQRATHDPYRDLTAVRHVYGSALAMQLATERSVAIQQSQQLQLHGRVVGSMGAAPSSSLYGEITQGRDVDLQFEDYLNQPQDRPDHVAASGSGNTNALLPHAVMEQQLGMMKVE